MSGHHAARVADQVRRILAEVIRGEVRDPRVSLLTLNDVRVSPDLRQAVGYVSVPEGRPTDEALRALNRAVPFLRRTLARRAGLRHTPELRFEVDEAAERGARLERLFEDLRVERPPSDER